MKWSKLRVCAAGAVVCAAALMMGASEARAGWGSHGSYGGSSGGSYGSSGGGWGSYGSSGGYSSGYSGYSSHGSHGGFFARLHSRLHRNHNASFGGGYSSGGSYGSYGGSYGSYGSHGSRYAMYSGYGGYSHGSYGSYGGYSGSYGGSYGSSGGSYGSSGGSSGGVIYGGKAVEGTVVPESEGAVEAPVIDDQAASREEATLTVKVPAEAKIFVNGNETTSVGAMRSYVSRGLKPGLNYAYVVRAEMERDGKTVEETKTVNLQAGRIANLTFALTEPEAPLTSLTLNVPAEAKVYLAGNETTSSGSVREFNTRKLSAGKTWENYTIRVTVDHDGQVQTREKTIALAAGDNQTLTFDFDAPQVAAR